MPIPAGAAPLHPGHRVTDLVAGSTSGDRLLWVVALSRVMGKVLQSLGCRLGLATGLVGLNRSLLVEVARSLLAPDLGCTSSLTSGCASTTTSGPPGSTGCFF